MVQANGTVQTAGVSLPPPTRRDLAAQIERLVAVLERMERGELASLRAEIRILQRSIEGQSR